MTMRDYMMQHREKVMLTVGILGKLLLVCVSLFTGVYHVTTAADGWDIFFITRVPRTIALVLAGAAMAIAGLIMQLMTQNRFVEPTTTGTIEWAGLGLITAMIVIPEPTITQRMVCAVAFSFAGTMIFFLFLRKVTLKSSLVVPIIGIMLGAVVSAFSTFIALQYNLLQSLGIWFSGSFTMVMKGRYELIWIVLIVTIIAFIIADKFTVVGLGKDIATNVGINYDRIILIGVTIVAVITGVVAVVIGSLPFLGLIVPNVISMIRGDNLRTNLPWVCLAGIWTVGICDIVGRIIIAPFEIPVATILSIVGAIGFIAILLHQRKRG
ncbi:Iron-uptake system permease protein FeuB [Arcanobacterium haemolyticum]|uniref:Transport system permease protein n=2 Tax=Arcanobacterium haemolyticum TaxID=28264 RepID=D7BPF4_ARCHD|nr:iron chelate uptake ABC transporter family permease subunit [Arcanobacterium haemolyticum]ADH92803.1 transport system permease protein [Arcanobacterium haemolyticum DSM 20595]SQH28449.1 Iron-uptake system permease protein FeuB [Arcanobacterium haemolyticum]